MKKLLAMCLLVGTPLLAQTKAQFRHHGWYSLPDSVATPGDALTSDTAKICHRRTRSVRAVSVKVKNQVHTEYNVHEVQATHYEVDHLIPLELGGSNSIKNLWPQIYPDAYEKDKVENELHRLVCNGKMVVRVAQRAIASDWVALRDSLSNSTKLPARK